MPLATTATTARPAAGELLARLTPPVAAFLAGSAPVVLLGFSRGGYPVGVVAGYGVALWWLLLVGLLTAAIPRPRPTGAGWVALISVVVLAVWGGVSLTWSADPERGLTEVVRLIVAGGSLLLGMSAVRAGQARVLAGGVLAGLSVVVGAAVLSRLQPQLFPEATETGALLQSAATRVSWPLGYWNTIAAAGAVAIPLGLALAVRARRSWTAALAVAPLPTLSLGIAFTLSRGGIATVALGLLVALAVIVPRPVLLRTLLAPAVGAGVLLLAGLKSVALTDVTGGAAQTEAGRRVIVLAVLVTVGVGLVQAGWTSADRALWTPRLPRTRGPATLAVVAVVVVALVVAALAVDLPGRASDGWQNFREPLVTATPGATNTIERLGSISSNGRYQMWSGAVDAVRADPGQGIGLGAWESWWNPRRGDTGFVRNAHSEVFELAAETGLLGGVLFLVLIGAPLAAGLARARRRRTARADGVLVLPALVAFAAALAVDWSWQIGAFMVAGMTLAAIPLARARREEPPPTTAADRSSRAGRTQGLLQATGIAVLAVAAIATLAVALIAPQAVDASRDAAARGDLAGAAALAAGGARAAGFAASPALQRALVEEQAGRLPAAESAARESAARAPQDWRPWFLVARIAVARGHDRQAVAAYRRARALNPHSGLLQP